MLSPTNTPRRRRLAMAAASVVGVLVVGACSGAGAGFGAAEASAPDPTPPAALQFSVDDGAGPVNPDQMLRVSAAGGELVSVRLTDPDGVVIGGRVADGVWQVPEHVRLAPETTYTWSAAARNADGEVTTEKRDLTTIVPEVTATYYVTPDGRTVGVGMPASITFDSVVETPEMRADVEERVSIQVTPEQSGSWGWLDDRQLMWRPDSYWEPGTTVEIEAPLQGVQTGENKWVGEDKGAEFTVADRARITHVDLANHVMTVEEDGRQIARYPISAGEATATAETRSGTKIITEKHEEFTMDAGTLGVEEDDPDYYNLDVEYAMRVTNTGEFFHAAPWSVWAQGSRNVSNGCVNLSTSNAREFYQGSLVGDVAEFTGSAREMKTGDGMTAWTFTPEEWAERSAIARS